jgi:hypothetical protein
VDDSRKAVGERLSGTRLGDTDNVATRESHGPALGLDSGGLCEALGLDLVHDVRREAGLVEGGDGLGDVLTLDRHLVLLAVFGNLRGCARGDCGILLVEGLLELGHRVEVWRDVSIAMYRASGSTRTPVLCLQAVAELRHSVTAVATTAKAAAAAAISTTTSAVATTAAAGVAVSVATTVKNMLAMTDKME